MITSFSVVDMMVSIIWRTRWLWKRRSLLLGGSFCKSFTINLSSLSTSSCAERVTSSNVDDIFFSSFNQLALRVSLCVSVWALDEGERRRRVTSVYTPRVFRIIKGGDKCKISCFFLKKKKKPDWVLKNNYNYF